ncbi:conserved hypothetical protein [Desulfatibacillum aliphaticivorans]|uniref:Uncharacterized protein n=1 Tax=Desulfatibacillum aliphaticivorans TaxID=218208 RepID=B8FGY2_DESAL|nr:hypothetical protein [Desulfatibacillum aliphaticivorans]ACL02070.1 conserved hypothetical protein [Desulfatibacillum aliphaticivorans]
MENSEFNKNVFINCPFDNDFRLLLIGIIFTVVYFEFKPRLALESADSGETRISKILKLINDSKFGIHDLSRILSSQENEYFRMNMPFELGIDYGCKRLKEGIWSGKKILILEKERYRFQKSISDLSGSDIKSHNDEVSKVVFAVRDWFITEELKRGDSGKRVWDEYNDFQAYLYDQVVEKDGHTTIDEVQIIEIIHYINEWFGVSH